MPGTLQNFFTTTTNPLPQANLITVENGGVDWLDVAQDGHTIFYTSKGRKIFMFDTTELPVQARTSMPTCRC